MDTRKRDYNPSCVKGNDARALVPFSPRTDEEAPLLSRRQPLQPLHPCSRCPHTRAICVFIRM